jgi:hypothetical protein
MKKVTFGGKPPSSSLPPAVDAWVTDRESINTEPTKRFTFDVPLSLHRRIKSQCALKDQRIADVVREILYREFPNDEVKS